jgi:hypothetical protein
VKEQIEAQMTPQQKEYWAAQGGYFEQVIITMIALPASIHAVHRVVCHTAAADFAFAVCGGQPTCM